MQFQNILEALKKNLAADLQLTIAPDKLQSLQAEYLQNMQALWTQGLQASTGNSDRRFAHEAWRKNPLSAFQVASYQLQAKTMTALAEQLQGDEKTVARLRFAVQQWLAAAAPRGTALRIPGAGHAPHLERTAETAAAIAAFARQVA